MILYSNLVDDEDTCEGNLCRLDVEFAAAISSLAGSWDAHLEARNGFDRVAECVPFSVAYFYAYI